MDRVLLVLGAVAIAGVVAMLLGRKPGAPASNTHHVPNLLDRNDFTEPAALETIVYAIQVHTLVLFGFIQPCSQCPLVVSTECFLLHAGAQ